MTNSCTCKAEHWQSHADSCPQAEQNKRAGVTQEHVPHIWQVPAPEEIKQPRMLIDVVWVAEYERLRLDNEQLRTALRTQSSESEMLGSIKWSETRNPDKECHYHHIIGQTPFGRIMITWKGWKDDPWPTVDESPWGFFNGGGDPESTKRMVESEYSKRLKAAIMGELP